MTITIDSIWVLIGIAIVLGFGGYLGLSAAIALRKCSEWVGAKLADLVLYIICLIKRRRENTITDGMMDICDFRDEQAPIAWRHKGKSIVTLHRSVADSWARNGGEVEALFIRQPKPVVVFSALPILSPHFEKTASLFEAMQLVRKADIAAVEVAGIGIEVGER